MDKGDIFKNKILKYVIDAGRGAICTVCHASLFGKE